MQLPCPRGHLAAAARAHCAARCWRRCARTAWAEWHARGARVQAAPNTLHQVNPLYPPLNPYALGSPPPPSPPHPPPARPQAASKPVIYYGGGCLDSRDELREFAKRTGMPLASTFMGLGVVPSDDPQVRAVRGSYRMYSSTYGTHRTVNACMRACMQQGSSSSRLASGRRPEAAAPRAPLPSCAGRRRSSARAAATTGGSCARACMGAVNLTC